MKNKMRLGIIGFGNMGAAIAAGGYSFLAYDKDHKKTASLSRGKTAENIKTLAKKCDPIIVAVKPQDINELLVSLSEIPRNKLIISIAAGINTRYIESGLGTKPRVVRVMPNIAAKIKESFSALCPGKFATSADIALTEKIFSRLGKTAVIKEKDINSFTAIAGSGPAYFFYLTEALAEAAVKIGFSRRAAEEYASQTAYSSGALLKITGLPAEKLRLLVTSKKGTTEAGIKVFDSRGLKKIIEEAVLKAKKRAEELAI